MIGQGSSSKIIKNTFINDFLHLQYTLYMCYLLIPQKTKDNDNMSFKNAKSSIKFCSKQLVVYLLSTDFKLIS